MSKDTSDSSTGANWFDSVLRHFELDVDAGAIIRNLALVRVLFGFGLLHRYVDVMGYGAIHEAPATFQALALTAAICALLVMVGLLTPLALVGTFGFAFSPQFGSGLVDQNIMQLCWMLLLLGAGRSYSLDGWLSARGGSRLLEPLYALAMVPNARSLACMRLFVLLTYGSICLSAAAFHFDDAMWLEGKTLQLLMVTPYMSDLAEASALVRDAAPGLYHHSLQVGLLIQTVFEVLLVPLLLWRWGRVFVALQWLGFIAIRGVSMNLGYLCYIELVLWLAVYNYRPFSVNLLERQRPVHTDPSPLPVGIKGFLGLTTTAVVVFTLYNTATIVNPSPQLRRLMLVPGFRPFYRLFAQEPVNVFNRQDMAVGAAQLVLFEVDDSGRPVRTVPFMDDRGGRLDYLRNDYLYFALSLPFQRAPASMRARYGPTFAMRVAALDSLLQPSPRDRSYVAITLRQRQESFQGFERWGATEYRSHVRFGLTWEQVRPLGQSTLFGTFELPPGHLGSKRRAARSLETAQALWREGKLGS